MVNTLARIQLCTESELRSTVRVTKWINEWNDEISAFYDNGTIIILSTVCPHFGGELEKIKGQLRLRCKWHGWEYDMESGKCLPFPIAGCLRRLEYVIQEGVVEVSPW